MDYAYPAGPQHVSEHLTAPTSAYKRHAWLAMLGLGIFVALYVALSGWFVWTAYRLLAGAAKGGDTELTAILGGCCAAFLAVFMLKALFFVKHRYEIDDIEVTAEQQPELFAFLNRLADEAKAPRAHRVFLSPRVNAAVFYDLSILNLILPSKKNLEIGLGLVNVLSLGEFKAVLAHEFGHFAQRSMAVGRWVYIAQQIAGHIISSRDALDSFLRKLSRFDLRIAWIGWLLSLIVWSIRSVMETLFRLVILAQRALSREMEFQADLVAVSLTGSDALIHALHRLQAADDAWERAINFAAGEAHEHKPVSDVFAVQQRVIEHLRRIFGKPDYGLPPALPEQDLERHRVFKMQLAQAPRMWATHPSNVDREANAKRTYIHADIHASSAWDLFADAVELRERMSRHIFKAVEDEPAPLDESLKKLDAQYERAFLLPEYRGVYLGRSVVRYAAQPSDLYVPQAEQNTLAALDALYPESIATQLENVRSLHDELQALEALRNGVATASGGVLQHRGRQVQRGDLPKIIDELRIEIKDAEALVQQHDALCRSVHVAIAQQFGQGWDAYLRGLLQVLHYADHSEANLRDVQGYLGNVYAVVTADGRVSRRERKRLVAAANQVHEALASIYAQAAAVVPDRTVLHRLEVESWSQMLGEFTLSAASSDNIGQWLGVVDSWINGAAGALSALRMAALNQLLIAEKQVGEFLRKGLSPREAPPASQVPAQYPLLMPGTERERQTKLDLWSRFHTADGVFATIARLTVAGGIIAGVLLVGGSAGKSTLTVYNGLERPVRVELGAASIKLAALSSGELDVPAAGHHRVKTTTDDGRLIESFDQDISEGFDHYVYNVAAASPLVEWTATYGGASGRPDRNLGAARWTTTTADFVFEEPPDRISSKTGGGTRDVLSGMGKLRPSTMLSALSNDTDRLRLIDVHARWDSLRSRHILQWLVLAARDKSGGAILQARLHETPLDPLLLRVEQDEAGPDARASVCQRHDALLAEKPNDPDLQYIADRCLATGAERDAAFLAHYRAAPDNPWLALAAGYTLAESERWAEAVKALDLAQKKLPQMAEFVVPDLARIERMLGGETTNLAALAQHSDELHNLLQLESGKGVTGPYLAYRALAQGKLAAALQYAKGSADVSAQIALLVAASDGARSMAAKTVLDQPMSDTPAPADVWFRLGLAIREGRDTAKYRAFLSKNMPGHAQLAEQFNVLIRNPAKFENDMHNLSVEQRGYAYAAAVIALGDRAPARWRQNAKRLLFPVERPYFG